MRTAHLVIAALMVLAIAPVSHANGVTTLAGTKWRPALLSGFAGSDDRPVFLMFETADKAAGFAGCNRFFGSFKQSGEKLTMGPFATTRMACAALISDRETAFLKTLEKARLFDVSDGELALRTWEGAVLLRLAPHR